MSGVLNLLLAGAASAIKDAYYNLTTLLLNTSSTNGAQNNTFLDSSTNNFTITRNGNTTQGTFTPFSQTGWSNYFNGSSDYLTAPANAVFDFSSGDFTVEAWVNPTTSGTERAIISKWNNSGATQSWLLELNSSNIPLFYYSTTGSDLPVLTGTTAISANTWTHIAVTRSGNTWTIWVNGVSSVSSTITSTIYTASATTVNIGRYYGAASYAYWPGYISNARVVKGTAVYTSAFTPPTTPLTAITNTSLLTCQSNRFVDNSTNAFAITVNGTPSVQAFSPFLPTAAYDTAVVGGSGYFDGSGDVLTVPSNSAFDFAGNVTIELWAYWTGNMGVRQDLIHHLSNGFEILKLAGDTIYCGFGGGTITSSITVKTGQWYHIALVRSSTGASGLNLYINGVNVGSATAASSVTSGTMAIGAQASGNQPTSGYFSSLRIVKGTAVYTTTFTPPTAPVTAITNTSLLLNYTNAGIYDSAAKNVLETVGNAQVSTTQAKWGTTSMAFDGTGDYLLSNPATTDLYAFGSGDWTIEFWAYLNSVTGTQTFYDGRPASVTTTQPTIYMASAVVTYYANGSDRITGSTLSTGQWYHIAVSRSGTSTKMFVNGTQVGSTYTDSTVYTNTAGRPVIAANGSSFGNFPLNGYLDDFRVTKGYARYVSNFSVPTAAFPTQ